MTKHVVELPEGLAEAVVTIAAESGSSLDDIVAAALIGFLEDQEDLASIAEYERRLAAGETETISLEEWEAKHGLGDSPRD